MRRLLFAFWFVVLTGCCKPPSGDGCVCDKEYNVYTYNRGIQHPTWQERTYAWLCHRR